MQRTPRHTSLRLHVAALSDIVAARVTSFAVGIHAWDHSLVGDGATEGGEVIELSAMHAIHLDAAARLS